MEYLVLFVVLVLFLMIKSASERRRRERELEQTLRDRFGTLSEEEYSEEKYRSIQYYFRSRKSSNQFPEPPPCCECNHQRNSPGKQNHRKFKALAKLK